MTISDILEVADGGRVLAGVNPLCDALDLSQIRKFIGSRIIIDAGGSAVVSAVEDISITTALTGRKNIFILVDDPRSTIRMGCTIHTFPG